MQVHYLEIVTQEVDATCATYAQLHGVKFGEGNPDLGNARTAALANGGMIGVRAPMHESEEPVVRPYLLVKDIDAAVAATVKAGGEIVFPPHGKPRPWEVRDLHPGQQPPRPLAGVMATLYR